MGWYDLVKSYVWDDRTTPYLVPAARLTRPQADRELFTYSVFVSLAFSIGSLAAFAHAKLQHMPLLYVAGLHALTIVGAVLYVGMYKHVPLARYCLTAPVMALAAFASGVFNPRLMWFETLGLCAFSALWFYYGLRVVAITRAYPDMPARLPDNLPPLPLNLRRRGGGDPADPDR